MKIATVLINRRLINSTVSVRKASSTSAIHTEEWSLFPREREGNIYSVNWSLCEDGVTPVGDAYRNARVPILLKRLGLKSAVTKVELTKPTYFGAFKVTESGDTISHESFKESFDIQTKYFEDGSGVEMFVEDGSIGSSKTIRNGVRVITDDPAIALIARALLIPSPERENVNHRARFKGWNFDPRWKNNTPIWNNTTSTYDLPENLPKIAKEGERPIVAFTSKSINIASVQFVENNNEIVGANVLLGTSVPIRSMIDAIGHACTVLVNQQQPDAISLASTSIIKGKDTAVIINADDSIVDIAVESGLLYGAYHNTLSPMGVSAMWNGYIGKTIEKNNLNDVPLVSVNGKSAIPTEPYNLVFPAKHIIFYEKGAKQSKLSIDEAIQKLVDLTDESKTEAIKTILKTASISIIGNSSDVASIF